MNANTRFYIYIVILLFAFTASLLRVRRLDKAFIYLMLILGLTLLSEVIAHVLAVRKHNNMIVFHFYSPMLLLLAALYYHYSNPIIRRYNTARYVCITGIAAAILNTCYLQPLSSFNTNYILFTGFCIIGMALITFYHYYMNYDEINLIKNPYFQVSLLFLFYWSSTFISFAFHELLDEQAFHGVYQFIWVVNVITYSSLGFILLFYKKGWRHFA